MGFPGGAVIKNTPANAGDMDDRVDPGSNPGSGRSHGYSFKKLLIYVNVYLFDCAQSSLASLIAEQALGHPDFSGYSTWAQ